jgi:hypothetical protein
MIHTALLILMCWLLASLALTCLWATASLLLDRYCTRDMWAESPHVRGAIERNSFDWPAAEAEFVYDQELDLGGAA